VRADRERNRELPRLIVCSYPEVVPRGPWCLVSVVASLSLLACGDDAVTPPEDSGTSDSSVDGGTSLAAPPAPPAFGACPEGWSEVEVAGVTACEAWAGDATPVCDDASAAFPSEGGCVLVGSACPAGDFSEDATGADVLFVRPGGSGDGSEGDPFGRIDDALRVARSGTTVALAKGRYDEPIEIPRGVTVLGACPGETILTAGTFSPSAGVVDVWEPDVVLRDVTVGETSRTALWAHMGASATLEGVVIREASDVAVVASSGGNITATSIRVTGTVDTTGVGARGFEVGDGGQVVIRRAMFDDNGESAVYSTGIGTRVTAEDVAVLATRSNGRGFGGQAFAARQAGTLFVSGAMIEGNRSAAVAAFEPGSRIEVDQAVIRGTLPATGEGFGGRAASATEGAIIAIRRALVVDNAEASLHASASTPGTFLEVEDSIIGRTADSSDGRFGGRGVTIQDGAAAELTRVVLFENGGVGVFVSNASTATLTDVEVRNMHGDPDGRFGRGINVQTRSSLFADRVVLSDVRDTGLYVSGPDATATVNDLVVRGVRARGTENFGRGLDVYAGATLAGARVVVEDSRDVALHTTGPGSRIAITGARVAGTLFQDCAATTCTGDPAGHGAGAYDGAELILEDFTIHGSAFCGSHVAGGRLVLRQGTVSGNEIGACVQTDGYDLELLRDGVDYRDNGSNLDVTMLPVPAVNDDAI